MSLNLIDLLKSQAGSALVKHASSFLGENEASTQKAMDGILPSLLGGLVQQGMSKGGGNMLMDLISNNNLDGSLLNNVSGMLSSKKSSMLTDLGGTLMTQLFGGKTGSIANMIGNFAGVKRSSSNSMMSMAMPLIMSMVGKYAKGKGISGLTNLLSSQTGNIKAAMPAGLSGVADLLGFANGFGDSKSKTPPTPVKPTPTPTPTPAPSGGGMGRILPWLVGLAAIAGIAYYMGGCGTGDLAQDMKDKANQATEVVSDAANDAANATKDAANSVADGAKDAANATKDAAGNVVDGAKDAANAAGEMISDATKSAREALSNLTFAAGSAGQNMYDYLKGDAREADKSFRFNNVNFATGSAKLTNASMAEINNLAAVLKAYPKVNAEIQGYTDNTGNAAKNVTLSNERAAAVMAQLLKQGIGAGRLTAKGYGASSPAATNDTPEGRAQNRRIEVKIMK